VDKTLTAEASGATSEVASTITDVPTYAKSGTAKIGSTAVENHTTSGHPGNFARLLSAAPEEGVATERIVTRWSNVLLWRVQLAVS
jgi:hypothetical protein